MMVEVACPAAAVACNAPPLSTRKSLFSTPGCGKLPRLPIEVISMSPPLTRVPPV